MTMHTLIGTTLAVMSASAMNHVEVQATTFVEVGCFLDVQASANYTRALPVFFCSNGLARGPSAPRYPTCANQPNQPPDLNKGWAGLYNMTHAVCNAICQGHVFFGVENGGECYCGSIVPSQGKADPTACNSSCTGNLTQTCGGIGNQLSVFQTDASPPPPLPPPSPPNCTVRCDQETTIFPPANLTNLLNEHGYPGPNSYFVCCEGGPLAFCDNIRPNQPGCADALMAIKKAGYVGPNLACTKHANSANCV
jgi:hypothetical protein